MIRRPPRSTQSRSSAASDVYKRQAHGHAERRTDSLGSRNREAQRRPCNRHLLDADRHALEEHGEIDGLSRGRGLRVADACQQCEDDQSDSTMSNTHGPKRIASGGERMITRVPEATMESGAEYRAARESSAVFD